MLLLLLLFVKVLTRSSLFLVSGSLEDRPSLAGESSLVALHSSDNSSQATFLHKPYMVTNHSKQVAAPPPVL